MRNYAGTCKGICSYNFMYNFLIQLLSLKSLVFLVHFFLNAFQRGNKVFRKCSYQNEIVPPLVIFHLPYSKYKAVKICFYSCRYQNQNFSLVSHSCCSSNTRVALVWFVQQSCCTRFACVSLVLLVLHSCRIGVARVWHSCCKLDQIELFHTWSQARRSRVLRRSAL